MFCIVPTSCQFLPHPSLFWCVLVWCEGTVVSPVHDGWTEVKGISRSKVGGRYMDAFLLQILEQQQSLSKPLFKLHKTLNSVTGEVEVTDNKAFLEGGRTGTGAALRVHPSYDAFMYLEMARCGD